ncbi:MAG: guanylate kinase [Bacilli bacterium]
MKLDKKGLLVVISGPSGVGKGTVRKALFSRSGHDLVYSISMTTRKPRNGEIDGVDYYFVSKEKFEEEIEKGNLLEYAQFVGNYYGTPYDKVLEQLNKGNEVVLEIEVQGAMQVKAKKPDAVFIFIAPPSYGALEERLKHRGTENDEIIKERLQKARREIDQAPAYDYIVINDDVDNAADRIMAIIRAEHAKCERSLEEYYKLMEGSN